MPFYKEHKYFNTGRTRFKKGLIPWNKEKKCPSISLAKIGHTVSESTREKLSAANTGDKNPHFGKKFSKITCDKISKATLGKKKSDKARENMSKAHLGKKLSAKTVEKMRLRKGSNHPNWKGGITPLVRKIRNSLEMRQWRSDIFTRDGFVCSECGEKGGVLAAHHKKTFSKIMEEYNIKTWEQALLCVELWNINNGETLCDKCHKNTKTYGNRKT